MNAMTIAWEAVYSNGTVVRERDGHLYQNIDRAKLAHFILTDAGRALIDMPMQDGHDGWHFFYRRRTVMTMNRREVWFLMGFIPMGPIHAFNPGTGQLRETNSLDPDEQSGIFHPIVPIRESGEHFQGA